MAEYLDAGTTVVVVLDDKRRLAHVYRADGTTRVLAADEELTIPDLLGDFRVRVGRFFEPVARGPSRRLHKRPAVDPVGRGLAQRPRNGVTIMVRDKLHRQLSRDRLAP